MHNELSNKVGIVTGGSSGIGFQIANVLAEAGATVYVISRTGQPKEGYGSSVPGVIHIKGDIGDASSMTALLEEITAPNDGVLDFLVNNAGVSYKCRAEDFPMDRFDQIMDVNVKYVFQLSVLCYPHLKKSAGRGRIVNITSMSAHLGFSEVVPYCTSKGAVLAMTRGLAVEWAGDNICVNSIAPGWTTSPSTASRRAGSAAKCFSRSWMRSARKKFLDVCLSTPMVTPAIWARWHAS